MASLRRDVEWQRGGEQSRAEEERRGKESEAETRGIALENANGTNAYRAAILLLSLPPPPSSQVIFPVARELKFGFRVARK